MPLPFQSAHRARRFPNVLMHSMRLTAQSLRLAAVGLIVAALSACSLSMPFERHGVVARIDKVSQGDLSSRPALAEVDGRLAMLYATADNRVAFRIGDKTTLLDASIKAKGGRFFKLYQAGGALYALWWSHEGGKALYCAASHDGGETFDPVQVVNSDHGVLPPFSVVSGRDGTVGVAYMDERSPTFEVYFNRSTDGGKSWAAHDQRLDTAPKPPLMSSAAFPKMVQSGNAWIVVWTDSAKIDGQPESRVLVRTSTDEGRDWSPAQVIYHSTSMLSSVDAEAAGNAVVVVLQDTLKGVVALRSGDQGKTWSEIGSAQGSQAMNNSGIQIASGGDRVYAVWLAQRDNKSKGTLMADVLDLAAGKWIGQPQRIDTGKPIDQTLSLQPNIVVTGSGAVAVSWTDFRDIRPNIYLTASFDQGKAWTAPQDMERPGEYSSIFSSLLPRQHSVLVSYERFAADDHKTREALVVDVGLKPGVGFTGLPQPKPIDAATRERLLKERVAALWKLRVDRDFSKTYGYFDPAYRNVLTQQQFDKAQGNITYHSAKTDKIAIEGNVAQVTEKLDYEVKGFEVMGRKVDVPRTTADVTTTWVWIYDNWYMVYQPAMGQPFLQY